MLSPSPHIHPATPVAVLLNLATTPVQLRTKLFQTGDPTGRGISSYLDGPQAAAEWTSRRTLLLAAMVCHSVFR